MANDDTMNPMACSSDHKAMQPHWRTVSAILEGVEAMRRATYQRDHYIPGPAQPVAQLGELQRGPIKMTWSESPFLPKFPNENIYDYELRRRYAPLTNIYSDISSNLASKPFAKKLDLDDKSPDQYKKLAENIDGQGNNLHVFASAVFKAGLDYALDWILVDYTKVPAGATLADERGMGARPYWVRVPAERMLAAYSDFVNGSEIIVHARIHEPSIERLEYAEVCIERVRVFNREPIYDGEQGTKIVGYQPATWEIFEEVESKDSNGNPDKAWQLVDAGNVSIGEIPLVPYIPGVRHGTTFRASPELGGLAHLQVEEFQQESNLKTIKELTAFPMLAILGAPPIPTGQKREIEVGPRAAICIEFGADGSAPSAQFIEPGASSLTFLQVDLEKLRTEMRNLGMQPLATANLTVITTANVAMKAHSAVQAWTIKFKDALERAWGLTAKWLNASDQIEVSIHTDFGVDFEAGTELDSLLKAQAQGVLSKQTVQDEFKRRGVLSDDFDSVEEAKILAEEEQGLTPEVAINPVTGALVHPTTKVRVLNPTTTVPPSGKPATTPFN